MRIAGALLMLCGAGLLYWGYDYEVLAVMHDGAVSALQDPNLRGDRFMILIMGGFAFLSGAVLFGAGSVAAAIKANSTRNAG